MAAVDPKELLARNKVLVGAYVLAIVPIVLTFVVVDGVRTEFDQAKQKLTGKANSAKSMAQRAKSMAQPVEEGVEPPEPVYTQTDVQRFQARQELYQKELAALGTIVNGADQRLERWFEEVKVGASGKVDMNEFLTIHERQCKLLAEKHKALAVTPAGEVFVNAEAPTSANSIQQYQKRFWVQEAILEALAAAQEGNPGAPLRLHSKLDFPAPAVFGPGQAATQKPFETIPVRVTILCPFARVPLVVRQLVAREGLPMKVTSLRVDKEPFGYDSAQFPFYDQAKPRFSVAGGQGIFEQDVYTATLTNKDHYTGGAPMAAAQERWIPEPAVKVELVVEAYDFREIKPPAAEGEGEGAAETTTEGGK